MLVVAHDAEVIQLGGPSWVQCKEWQFLRLLTVGARMKLGHLWKIHGRKILEHQQGDSLAPEQLQTLEGALQEAS